MFSVYEFESYQELIKMRFASMPKSGYGQSKKLAEFLGVHTTLVSQVMKGLKSFTPEQAVGVSEFLSLGELESEYLLLLVQRERAGTPALKRLFDRRLKTIRANSKELVHRLKSNRRLTEIERAEFYSDWTYSAVRQLPAIAGFQNVETIAELLDLPVRKVADIVKFLTATGLCVAKTSGLTVGPSSTHLESSSKWVTLHHRNWRLKALTELSRYQLDRSLHYTAPMTLSKSDSMKISEMIAVFLESVDKLVEPSPSEELYCLNLDWFRV